MDDSIARNTLARYIVAELTRTGLGPPMNWEDFPEVGEDDWNRVVAEALIIATNFRPPVANVTEAIKVLAARADKEV